MKGYLVFTGEPHLVFFSHNAFEPKEVSRQLFLHKKCKINQVGTSEKRAAVSNEFVNFIGNYFVRKFYDLFPVGINLNFVLIADDRKSLEHRCFERGINHETLACGTGSLASAIVAKELDLIDGDRIIIRPHRCRWTHSQAELVVEKIDENWFLKGHPQLLFEGNYLFE
jgi:diaminopimelate epimerase